VNVRLSYRSAASKFVVGLIIERYDRHEAENVPDRCSGRSSRIELEIRP
jgi:hypothetical protein